MKAFVKRVVAFVPPLLVLGTYYAEILDFYGFAFSENGVPQVLSEAGPDHLVQSQSLSMVSLTINKLQVEPGEI